MIIPTAEYDPMYADDGVPFREKMTEYIIREFGDLLGPYRSLIHDRDDAAARQLARPTPIAVHRQSSAA